jgi:flagellar biosynthesis protein FliQ
MSSLAITDVALRAIREGLLLVLLVSAPPLLASMVVGLIVGALQAATQIHDQALSIVPKLVAVVVVLLLLSPMLAGQVLRFSQVLLAAIGSIR